MEHLRALAGKAPLVLLIDQLDAVCEVMDQSSRRMQVLLRLAMQLRAARGADGEPLPVHVVVSSRPFEAKFDARFRHLEAEEFELSPPPYERVEALMIEAGIDPAKVPATFRETLRSPFALGLYVDLVKLGASPDELTPGNLLDRWLDRKLPVSPGRAATLGLLRRLASDMTDCESLWRPAALYEPEFSHLTRAAAAVGLLRREADMIGFAHQSWLDDFQAKRFATGQSLADFAWSRQDGLFARGTVLRGLEHLRKSDRPAYDAALRLLLGEVRTRRHLKHLAADFIAGAAGPFQSEVAWVEWMMRNDRSLANRAISRVAQYWPSWRDGLKPMLPLLMQSEEHRRNAAHLLAREATTDPEGSMDLIERFWRDAKNDEMAFRVICQAPLPSERATARLKQIFERTLFDEWAISHLVTTFSAAGATSVAIEVAADWAKSQVCDRHRALRLHDLEKVAEQAPLLFAKAFMPWFVQIAGREVDGGGNRYPQSRSLPFGWRHEREQGVITEVLHQSLALVARTDPQAASLLLQRYADVEIDEVQRLIADTFAENPDALQDQAVAFLLADDRRLCLGEDLYEDEDEVTRSGTGWSTGNLIETLGSRLTDLEFAALRGRIEAWQPYRSEQFTDLGYGRLQWQRWADEKRLELLAKLPLERFEPRRRRQIADGPPHSLA